MLESIGRDKHFSSLRKLVSSDCKKFYIIGPWWQLQNVDAKVSEGCHKSCMLATREIQIHWPSIKLEDQYSNSGACTIKLFALAINSVL
jgi:hypothetical protein